MMSSVLSALLVILASPALAGDPRPLDRMPDAVLELPERSREDVPERVPVSGPWRLVGTVSGVRTWEAPLPVRPRTLFFHKPVDDLAVFASDEGDGSRKLKHASGVSDWDEVGTWAFTSRALRVRRAVEDGPPGPDTYTVRYTRAVEREAALNLGLSGQEPAAFAFRSVQIDDTTRQGVLLPAPARATWTITVPDGAVLDLDAALLPPEAADPALRSDGAELVVAVTADGERQTLLRAEPELARFGRHRVDLSAYAGQEVRLELETDPAGSVDLDYVFVADPTVHVPVEEPPRVVLVFVDTLRADHLSVYGYGRETTPGLDAWFGAGAVFEQGRSIAPWTLPSARTMVTGALPEAWGQVQRLPDRFAEAGWATAFLAGNVYLSSNFEMADGWGTHRVINWPNADVQVDRALDYLAAHEDRPVFLMLHLMDMHLPYTEPPSYRNRFAGEAPKQLPAYSFHRSTVVKAARKIGDAGKQYVVDRYDNNLAFVDDQLMRFLDELGPRDTVLLVSDHGEEFWDHGGFEHGHTLYDELLRVPMLWRGPGSGTGRHAEPVSLLDVAPTLATAAGLSTDGMSGWPLQDLVSGERTAEFAGRPQAFGRPLYGMRRWGVLHEGSKYTTHLGTDARFDLRTDPGEQDDRFVLGEDTTAALEAMATALGAPVRKALRLMPSKGSDELILELTVDGGVDAAFAAQDPRMRSKATVSVDGDRVRVVWAAGQAAQREVYVVPSLPVEEAALGLSGQLLSDRGIADFASDIASEAAADGRSRTFARIPGKGRTVSVSYVTVPVFPQDATQLQGFDDESKGALQVLGYVETDEEASDDEDAPTSARE